MRRFKVYAKNIITEDMSYLGEVWADTLYSAKQKAGRMYERELDAYDALVVERA